jgi:hypothetical protein
MERTDEEINKIGGMEETPTCPECGSEDTELVPTGCLCRIPGHSCWDAPHCNSCGLTGAGNSSGGLWFKPSYW